MISVGETLRRERVRRNLDLEQISQELKISAKFLDAIENEQFERLPARIFAKSFVRQYAHLLELDEEELADQVHRQLQPPPANPQMVDRSAAPPAEIQVPRVERWDGGAVGAAQQRSLSSSLPSLALFVVILLICSGIYSLWQRTRRNVSDHEETTASAPAAQQEPAPVPPPSAPPAAPPESQVAQSQPAGLPAQNPAPPPSAAVEQAPPAGAERASGERPANGSSAAPAAANPPASQATPVPAGGNAQSAIVRATDSANPELRLEVTATEPVWVLAQNNGKYLFSGTLEANQTRTIEADGTVTLRLGNAGGVNILLNGKPVGTVGPRGQVRTVQFTSGGFQIVPVPKPSVPLDDML